MPDTSIGFIGLGIMGAPMAANLARAGYPLVVHNRSRSKVEQFVAEHKRAEAAATPKEVAERTDVVVTMLPDSPDVEQVYLGEDSVIAGARAGQLLIDMSSIAPSVARAVASAASEVGASALDAPVSGGDVGAREGTLSIMVGGAVGRLRAGAAAARRDGQDDRARRRGRGGTDRQGVQPDPGGGHDRGRQRGARARLEGRRRPRRG